MNYQGNKISEKFETIPAILISFYILMIFLMIMILDIFQQDPFKKIEQEEIGQKVLEKESSAKEQKVCIGDECKIPEQLFDITFNLEDSLIQSSDELIGIVTFESFGTELTLVKLLFTILDQEGKEVHSEEAQITVETEKSLRKTFENLDLKQGKYTLILTTLYNVNVVDEFRQEFEISSKKRSILWILGFSIIMANILIIGFIIKLWGKNEK